MTDAPAASTVEVDAVLFDLDGVLVESAAVVEAVWRDFAARHGLDPKVLLANIHGRRMMDILERELPHLTREDLALEAERVERVEASHGGDATPQPGALELLASLDGAPWAIVTSGTSPVAWSRIDAAGLPHPSVVVTAEKVAEGKPSPAPYLAAARELEADPSRCAVVEDAPAGVRAGASAGATTIAVTTSHAAEELVHADYVVGSTACITRIDDDRPSVALRLRR